MYELFNTDIANINDYNIIQLADWIKKCHCAIKRSDKKIYQEDYNKYTNVVYDFCEQWVAYAESHRDTYTSKRFKLAVKLSVMPKARYILITNDNKEIDVSDVFEEMQLQNLTSSKLIDDSIKREENRAKEYNKKLIKFIDGGNREVLHDIINYLSLDTFTYKISILENESSLHTKTIKQAIYDINKGKWKTDERKIEPKPNKTLSDYLIATIRDNHINKNLFYTFVKNKDEHKARVYNKSFFENVGFFLGLTIEEIEQVLCNEGYTISYSKRRDDEIVAKCFKYYFPQHYASALLFKEGYATLDIGK